MASSASLLRCSWEFLSPVGVRLDLVEVGLVLPADRLKQGRIADAQTRRETVQEHEAVLVVRPLVNEVSLGGQSWLPGHQARWVVAREGHDYPPVVAEHPPGQGVRDGPQLPVNALADIDLQLPRLRVTRVLVGAQLGSVGLDGLASPQAPSHSAARQTVLLDFQDLIKQRLLEPVVVRVTPALPKIDDELDQPRGCLLVDWM
jgi:hypothetical protein